MLREVQDGVVERVLGSVWAPGIVRFTFIPYMSLFVNAEQLDRLITDPQVVSIQEDVPSFPSLSESVPLIHAPPELWSKGVNGTDQVVAVLDTGVAKTHPMLAGKVVSEACYSTNNAALNLTSLCPGGVTSSTRVGSGVNCSTAIPGCDHGTHVASIAGGNSSVLDGVARDAKLISIQIATRINSAAECGGEPTCIYSTNTDQVRAMERVYALRTIQDCGCQPERWVRRFFCHVRCTVPRLHHRCFQSARRWDRQCDFLRQRWR